MKMCESKSVTGTNLSRYNLTRSGLRYTVRRSWFNPSMPSLSISSLEDGYPCWEINVLPYNSYHLVLADSNWKEREVEGMKIPCTYLHMFFTAVLLKSHVRPTTNGIEREQRIAVGRRPIKVVMGTLCG